MKTLRFARALIGLILMFAFVAACGSVPPETPTAVATLTVAAAPSDDNATSGAIQRSTRQAQATLSSQETATRQAAWASETARAQMYATATVVARVTGQAVFAAKSSWPKVLSESFASNALGWPLGVTTDTSPVVTADIQDGSYQWSVVVPHGSSYINLIPKKAAEFSAFYASVAVQFVTNDSGDQTSYGLVFRSVDRDYGFFGISSSGDFRILEVHDSGIESLDQESSELIETRPGQINRIAVVAVGPDFVFLINDQVVGQMNAQLDPGQIGLGVDALSKADQAQVKFSDFEIAAP